MNIIKTLIADLNALLVRVETEVGMHPTQTTAGASIKAAATALAQHPQASVQPSTIVSPGKEAPIETDAQADAASPANAAPAADAGVQTEPPAPQTPAA